MDKAFHVKSPDFLVEITPPEFEYLGASARSVGLDAGGFAMSDTAGDDSAPVVTFLRFPPGYVLPRHAHHCHRVEVVIEGSIETPDGKRLLPGDVATAGPGEFYGPHTAGPDGALTMELFANAAGMKKGGMPGDDAPPDVRARFARAGAALAAEPCGGPS